MKLREYEHKFILFGYLFVGQANIAAGGKALDNYFRIAERCRVPSG